MPWLGTINQINLRHVTTEELRSASGVSSSQGSIKSKLFFKKALTNLV